MENYHITKALKWAEEKQTEFKDLLYTLCAIPAPSGHEEKRAAFCKEWLVSKGAEGAYIDEALNVIFPYCDNGGEVTMFMAHTDTVFPDTEPFDVIERDGIAYCPGIGDDTINLAELMMTVAYVLENGIKPDRGIIFVCNSCEEGLGNLKGSRAAVEKYGSRMKEFYTFDGQLNAVVVKAVGSKRYRIEVKTEGGHSFNAFGNANAIEQLASVVVELYKISIPQKPNTKTTMNVGTFSGGTSVNTIAQQAEMLFEYRSDDRECMNIMDWQFNKVIESARVNGIDITVETVGERPCMGDVDPIAQAALTDKCVSLLKKYHNGDIALNPGSTDCNIPWSQGIPSVCIGGYIGGGAHTREEYARLDSFEPGLKMVMECILSSF